MADGTAGKGGAEGGSRAGESARRGGPKRTGPVALALLALIRVYQLTLSAFIGRHCRHLPSCSDYASEAIREHGAWAGFWLGFFRVLRCHPFGTHGLDPVPETDVPRHDPLFWRYARFGRTRARPENTADTDETGDRPAKDAGRS